MDETDLFSSFWGHIEALRQTLLRVLGIICAAMILCLFFHDSLITWLTQPLAGQPLQQERLESIRIYNHDSKPKKITIPENGVISRELSPHAKQLSPTSFELLPSTHLVYSAPVLSNRNLVILNPLEGIWVTFKISLWIGIFISSPLWLFALLQFIVPGLHVQERRLLLPFILTSLAFISLGCAFALLVTIPLANQYLLDFNQTMGMNLWSLSHYLDYTLFLLLANGIAFELAVIGIFFISLKGISAESLAAKRRVAILAAFILAAVLTPPDVLTQLMLAIPLIVLYEGLILYAKFYPRFV